MSEPGTIHADVLARSDRLTFNMPATEYFQFGRFLKTALEIIFLMGGNHRAPARVYFRVRLGQNCQVLSGTWRTVDTVSPTTAAPHEVPVLLPRSFDQLRFWSIEARGMIWKIGRYLTPGEAWASLFLLMVVQRMPRYHRCFHVSCAGNVDQAVGPQAHALPPARTSSGR